MKKQTKAEKNKARYIELNTLDRPLTDKEETELRFLEKRMEDAERIAQFKKNQAEPYASKRSRAVNLAWEFYRNIDIDGQCATICGCMAANDVFGYAEKPLMQIREEVERLTARYSKGGEKFLLEDMEKIGFKIISGHAVGFVDETGKAVRVKS